MLTWIDKIRQDLGFKIGLFCAASLVFAFCLILLLFSLAKIDGLSKYELIQTIGFLSVLLAGFSLYVVKLAVKICVSKPLSRISKVLSLAERGEMKARVQNESQDEIGQLSQRLNKMLLKISELEKIKIHADRKLVIAEEELKYKKALEEKTKIIEDTNEKLKVSLKEFSLLSRLSHAISSILDPSELYILLSELIPKEFEVSSFGLFVLDQRKRFLVLQSSHGFLRDDEDPMQLKIKMGEGLIGEVAKSKRIIHIKNTSMDPRLLGGQEEIEPDRCVLSLPILRKQRLLGVLYFSREKLAGFKKNEIELLTTLSSQVAVSLDNSNLYSKTKELTQTDDLTAIYNRRFFYQALQMEVKRSKRFGRPVSLLMIDVDHFKSFNDNFGHLVGDQVLRELAAVLQKSIREVDTLARYGGEEFSLILVDTSSKNAQIVAEKLRAIVEDHFKDAEMQGKKVGKITISLGISTLPSDAATIDDFINHADIALYSAKVKGRNQCVLYNSKTTHEKSRPVLKAI